MPQLLKQAGIAFKALRQLGPGQAGLYARYRLGLASGQLAARTRADVARALSHPPDAFALSPLFQLPDPQEVGKLLEESGIDTLLKEADEIAGGRVRLFGGEPVPMDLTQGASGLNWSAYARGHAAYPVQDVKLLWEPARFGWAFTLGRAYLLSGEERYAEAFWRQAQLFLVSHPANLGPQWVSAQEVALRILAFAWAAQAFAASPSSTPERLASLGKSLAAHAARIPATLSYSRAQNNNHLLSEAAGLLTTGLALRAHPQSSAWIELGWKWLERGLLAQISAGGTYIQHSTSYQRLMLHLALWVEAITRSESHRFSAEVLARLSAATIWLHDLLDPLSGQVPNLGPNDGANILPLTTCAHHDYRPVLQAASQAFLGERSLPAGAWDELGLWLGLPACQETHARAARVASEAGETVLHNPTNASWAYLRAVHFTSRPGHADQLHLDLWWRGLNLAQDAGTFLYNAAPPWNNSLAHTAVHNTILVDGQEQMFRAGRFLYLDWAQAQVIQREHTPQGALQSLTAQQDGYTRLGVTHQRTVATHADGSWQIDDRLIPAARPLAQRHRLRLHWLVPDWPWQVEEMPEQAFRVELATPQGQVSLVLESSAGYQSAPNPRLQIVRAGEVHYGQRSPSPTWGWVSPTYGIKLPALSVSLEVEAALPVTFTSRWHLPGPPQ